MAEARWSANSWQSLRPKAAGETSSAAYPCWANLALRRSLHSKPVRSEPNPIRTIAPQCKFAGLQCNEHATWEIAEGLLKSLTAQPYEGIPAGARFFLGIFLCHDLDVTVKSPPRLPARADHFHFASDRFRSFPLKTRWMSNFWTRFFVGHADASQSTTETEIARELFIRIRESQRAHKPGCGNEPPAPLRGTEPGQPQVRTI